MEMGRNDSKSICLVFSDPKLRVNLSPPTCLCIYGLTYLNICVFYPQKAKTFWKIFTKLLIIFDGFVRGKTNLVVFLLGVLL